MYLGSRVNLVCREDPGYLRAAGYYLDVITTNIYGGLYYDWDLMINFYRYSGKPFLVTECIVQVHRTAARYGKAIGNTVGNEKICYVICKTNFHD